MVIDYAKDMGYFGEIIKKDSFSILKPCMLIIELTYKCNFNCVHCYIPEKDREISGELTFEEIKDILDQAGELGVYHLCLTGGEPFLRKDISDIIHYARKKGFFITLKTNGSFITEEAATRLAEEKVNKIELSIYAFDEKGYETVTKSKGSFEKIINAIKFLKTHHVHVVIKSYFLKENIKYAKQIGNFIRKEGLKGDCQFMLAPRIDGSSEPLEHACFDPEIIKNAVKSFRGGTVLENKERKEKDRCGAGYMVIRIAPNGDVYPCMDLQTKLGNIRDEKILDIWKNSETLKMIRSIGNVKDLKDCSNCDLEKHCIRCLGRRINCTPEFKKFVQIYKDLNGQVSPECR